MNRTETHKVPRIPEARRLQEYGVGIFDATATKSALKKLLKKKCITVDGITASTATMIRGGETIQLTLPALQNPGKSLELSLEVIYEDEFLAAINKPAGIPVSGNKFRTITNALPQNLLPSKLPDACRPQPVHRLDYPTTGLLLVGKTRECVRRLNKMFEDKEISKTYYAIVIGQLKPEGEILAEIDFKPAKTSYFVKSMVASERFGQLNLVQLIPATGRRHQLRKHLSGIGHPILGDKQYGEEGKILSGKGLYLHASHLRITHPISGEKLKLSAPLPERFRNIFPGFDTK
ncbi:MAG: RluA family pseudouridine synthase [Flavobacteriaceae bacterium]|nr:RluA family pseudouridine synthase [Flavobacteriaceae bacterium]